ncbi:cytochrome c family protein [Acetobacter sp. TBRC 12305]|uniref:Cytochrome c family protein n=1 Tax=Acetobacter garciniae TaxID=2817435 RepID=A0A939KPP3_9PROT|nr:cytochrome c family protein [Acetobacter garciniae]MBO1324177.1 cytochrome c family protein [Acetobacter garciniae]MBX0343866.1 cytochrome c family protein [Acetobacter garciniae]
MNGMDLNRLGVAIVLSVAVLAGCYGVAWALLPDTAPPRPAFSVSGSHAAPIQQLLAQADASRGETVVEQVCGGCHALRPGMGDSVGPLLYGVFGRPVASAPDYAYSPALKRHAGTTWTAQALSDWLSAPDRFAPGTRMSFPGIADAGQRADIIAFLQTLRETPQP